MRLHTVQSERKIGDKQINILISGVLLRLRSHSIGYRLLAATDRIKAAVLIGAPSDAVNSRGRQEFHEHVYPGVVDGYETDPDQALMALSASYWPEKLASGAALLLLHGDSDERVPVTDALTMATHFARLQRSYRLLVMEQGSHTLVEHQSTVRTEIDRWFDVHLKECHQTPTTQTNCQSPERNSLQSRQTTVCGAPSN